MHASHLIAYFYIQQHLQNILSQFKNRLHIVGSISPYLESKPSQFKHNLQISMAVYTLNKIYHHQGNILIVLVSHGIAEFIE